MVKTILDIDGMMCGMCESHMNDAIRNAFEVEKVTSSHTKGTTEIISKEPLSREALTEAVEKTGYKILEINEEEYTKKKFSLFGK
ncbi:MAG: cation transporter [Lachnospiraceae bacterium]|nr:cation transporter [Lachnospiraceae bacterium]